MASASSETVRISRNVSSAARLLSTAGRSRAGEGEGVSIDAPPPRVKWLLSPWASIASI